MIQNAVLGCGENGLQGSLADFRSTPKTETFNLNLVKTLEAPKVQVLKDNQKTAKACLKDAGGRHLGTMRGHSLSSGREPSSLGF